MTTKKDTVTFEVITQEDPNTGDILLPLPNELLERMGWQEGDTLDWQMDEQNRWIISKK
jgi:hypothetical protein